MDFYIKNNTKADPLIWKVSQNKYKLAKIKQTRSLFN